MGNLDGFAILQQVSLAALKMAFIAIPLLMLIGFIDRVVNFMPWSIAYRALGKPWIFVRLDTVKLERNKASLLANEQAYRSSLGEWQMQAETSSTDQTHRFTAQHLTQHLKGAPQ
jgi:hypothetical protein